MILKRGAAVVVAALALAAAPYVQAEPSTASSTGHKPGAPGHSVTLDAEVDHPCAGRKLLYHSHNDALYGTRSGGKLAVMAVDGQQVTTQDAVCFRLAPDADTDGNDLSKLTIPDDGTLDFLGPRGSELWAAPQSVDWTDNWRPIWSGLGAFDPAHELDSASIPTNFKGDVMHFDLLEMDGPGDINVMFTSRVYEPERLFDSSDPDMRTITYEVGGHGHFTWTFSKPGVYALTWQGRAELKDGKTERSEPVIQYWLVGDDATVGLPDGTTTGLRAPKSSTPETSTPETSPTTTTAQPSPSPSAPSPSAPSPSPSSSAPVPSSSKQAPTQRVVITAGHMDMALVSDGEQISTMLVDDSDPLHPAHRPSGSFIFAVPDKARTDLPENVRGSFPDSPEAMWILPQAQDRSLPWLGFSTTGLAADAIADGSRVTVRMRNVTGPGRIMTWHEDLRGLRIELDSADSSKTIQYPVNAHDHQGFGFTEPGMYTATFVYSGTTRAGEAFEKELVASFAVGDHAIANAHADPNGAAGGASGGNLTVQQALAGGIRDIGKEIKKIGDSITPTSRAKQPTTTPVAKPMKPSAKLTSSAAASRPTAAAQPTAAARQSSAAQKSSAARPTSSAHPTSAARSAGPMTQAATSTSAASASTANEDTWSSGMHPTQTGADPQAEYVAAGTAPAGGGFWAGLAIGVGVMALIGGCVLFIAAWNLLRKAEPGVVSLDPDRAAIPEYNTPSTP